MATAHTRLRLKVTEELHLAGNYKIVLGREKVNKLKVTAAKTTHIFLLRINRKNEIILPEFRSAV